MPVRVIPVSSTHLGNLHGLRYYPAFRSDEEAETTLRGLILQIYWDGRAQPAVWSPLGDFFGTAPGLHPFRTVPTGMSRLECYSEWVMPYGDGMRMVLENRTGHPQTVDVYKRQHPETTPLPIPPYKRHGLCNTGTNYQEFPDFARNLSDQKLKISVEFRRWP